MNLYYIIIIILVALGVFWTSSPQSKDDLGFFNAAKKPDPPPKNPIKTDPPKKPPVAAPPQPKKGTKGDASVIKMKYKKPVDKKKVDKIQQQIKDVQSKLTDLKPGSQAIKDAEKKVKELQVQLATAQGQQAPLNPVDKKKVDKIQQQIKDIQTKLKDLKPGSQARKDAQKKLKELQGQLSTAQEGQQASLNPVDQKKVDALKQQIKDAQSKLEKTKPGSQARKDAQAKLDILNGQLSTVQGGVQTKDSSSTVNFWGGLTIPTRESLMAPYYATFDVLQAAKRAYADNPTADNKAKLTAANDAVESNQALLWAADAAGQVAAKATAAQEVYNKNPTDANRAAAAKANSDLAAAKLDLISKQAEFAKAQAKIYPGKCVPSKGKLCPIMVDNNSGYSQGYINQIQNYASDIYAQMAKDFPSLAADLTKPITIKLGLDSGLDPKAYVGTSGQTYDSQSITLIATKDSPSAINSVISHELFHTLQHKNPNIIGNVPLWLTEGSAEWARDKYGGKDQSGYHLKNNPTDPYTLGYGTSGGFLKYLDSKKPGSVAPFLNNVYGDSTKPYAEAIWQQTFGQPLQTLYNDYRTDLRRGQSVVTAGATSNQIDTTKQYTLDDGRQVQFNVDGTLKYL